MIKVICKGCGKEKDLNDENFHKHPHTKSGYYGSCKKCRNDKRNSKKSKYTYFYEILKGDEYKEGTLKAYDKDKATAIMKVRFPGWDIKRLCTFKYSKQAVVRARKGNK